jgi:hypothetical protein
MIRLACLAIVAALALAACGTAATLAPSTSAGPSATEPGGIIASTIPTQVGDVTLTVRSGSLADLEGEIPDYDLLVAGLNNLNLLPEQVRVAVGRGASGETPLTVAGLAVVDATPGGLGLLGMMQAWTSGLEDATVEQTVVGKPVTKVSFDDGSAPLYYYMYDSPLFDDNVLYLVRTADEALATEAINALPGPAAG